MNDIKKEDEIYCPECGKPVKRKAVFCVNCGVQLKPLDISPAQEKINNPYAKSKGTAIVLAVFFGFWSWLYTYKRDYKKFWIYVSIFIVFWIIIIVAISSITVDSSYDITQTPTGWRAIFANYGTWIWLLFLASFIWPFCNSVARPESFYKNYPNG
jgi:hypothetical protein